MSAIFTALLNPIVWLLLLVTAGISGVAGHIHGRADMAKQWELANEQIGRQLAVALARKTEIKTEIITKYVDRVTIVTEKADEIVREVPILVHASERVSAGFVCVADRGALGDPAATCDLDGTTGGAGADRAAEVIVRNYGRYHKLAAKVTALQEYVERVCKGDPVVALGSTVVGGAAASRDGPPPLQVAAGPFFPGE